MDEYLSFTIKEVYTKCELSISEFAIEAESHEYAACRFRLNNLQVVSRNSKITPKKVGQFVTFWKRNTSGIIEPLHESDPMDFYVVNVKSGNEFGQFVFPKSVLVKRGIVSTEHKEGKRGFRVYPKWDTPHSKQARATQLWQLNYFYEVNDDTDYELVKSLYQLNGSVIRE